MEPNQDGPVNLGLKVTLQDSNYFVYNLDLAKTKHLLFGGLCLGVVPIHAGCLLAFDTTRYQAFFSVCV